MKKPSSEFSHTYPKFWLPAIRYPRHTYTLTQSPPQTAKGNLDAKHAEISLLEAALKRLKEEVGVGGDCP